MSYVSDDARAEALAEARRDAWYDECDAYCPVHGPWNMGRVPATRVDPADVRYPECPTCGANPVRDHEGYVMSPDEASRFLEEVGDVADRILEMREVIEDDVELIVDWLRHGKYNAVLERLGQAQSLQESCLNQRRADAIGELYDAVVGIASY